MRVFRRRKRKREEVISRMEKWPRALNTTVSNTQIRPDELAEAQDIMLVEDGKPQCPRDGQAYFGSESGSRVTGLMPFYKSDGTRKLTRMSGTTLQVYNGSGWDNATGFTYTTTLNANGVTAYDRLYVVNGTDPLTYYDGSSVTSFTAISAPSAPTPTRTGSAGSFTFSYKIRALTANGQTEASPAGSTTLNQAVLDDTNYMTVTWSAVTNATGYEVYGRKDGDWRHITTLEGNGSTTYIDKGTITPSPVFTADGGNTTAGVVGKTIALYKDSLFIAGDPDNPSRLYYSGGGDHINDFTIDGGGGLIDISKNDGQTITGLIVFKNTLLVFKEDSTYQFSFTTDGLPQVSQVNPAIGAVAGRSIVAVENDVFFASRRGIFTIGNEAGFAFDVLRTNELSARVRSVYATIDPAYIENISAHYVSDSNKALVIFAYTPSGATTNSKALVYDRERLGWYKWSNIQANSWATWRGTDNVTHFLYGDDASGYVKEVLTGDDDFGTAIRGFFRIKAEHFGALNQYKVLKDIDLVLRRPTGSIQINIIKDGVDTVYTSSVETVSPTVNWGHYVFTDFLFGESVGSGAAAQDENVRKILKNVNLEGRSFMLEFDNLGTSASFTLLHALLRAKPRSVRFAKANEVIGQEFESSLSGDDQIEDLIIE